MTGLEGQNWLNGICPYFTMFPLEFPFEVLERGALDGEWVLDPFCGRGTTNYAARLLGLPSIGIDNSPVAVAISQAKLANTGPLDIKTAARCLLEKVSCPRNVPSGEFWQLAYHEDVLDVLCRFREALLGCDLSDAEVALRAIILGALHGPQPKTKDSYFSNQSQRTYAPKPDYAVRYWRKHSLLPRKVDVLAIIQERAERYFAEEYRLAEGKVLFADSRSDGLLKGLPTDISWVVTSPPYYGMRSYVSDQWLRAWFLGGPPLVDYSNEGQLTHGSPTEFSNQLRKVWTNVGQRCKEGATMVVRFGGINDRKAEPLAILYTSLENSGWDVTQTQPAGSASSGRRQASHIVRSSLPKARQEYDIWAAWHGDR